MALKDVKKMCSKFCNGKSSDIVGYTPPTLHKGVRWFVDFTSLDPARGLMRRKIVLFHVPYISSSYALGGIIDTLSLNGAFEAVCIVAIFPLIVWLAASGKTTDAASTRISRFLGDISCPLYIVHYPLMYAFYRWLIKTEQYTLQETWGVALAVVAGSIVLAWLSLKLYDRPVRKWLTKVWH